MASPRTGTWRERLLSPVGLHFIGFCIMAVATIALGIRVGLDWRTTSASSQDEMAGRQARLRALEVQTAPLRGLDKRVDRSRAQIDQFYAERVASGYSAILERLGAIQEKSGVRLTRVQYVPKAGSGDLSEIRMDAGISGNYPGILKFINGLERSQTFFVIRAMALTGQQSGSVNLRLEFSSWLRPADAPAVEPADTTAPDGSGNPNAAGPDAPNPAGGEGR